MPERNRVNPYGEIVATALRGAWMGNRGSIHRDHDIVRPWATKRWITCVLEYRGWRAPKWMPGRWTPLYFYDEALAFASGHRPCALCRRADYDRYRHAIGIALADDIDAQLDAERRTGREKRTHVMPWRAIPPGAYVELHGVPHVVLAEALRPWDHAHGYGSACARPRSGDAKLLTPPLTIRAIVAGYEPQIAH